VGAVVDNLPFLLGGLLQTVLYAFVALAIASVLGSVIGTAAYLSPTRWVTWPIRIYVGVIRNTPLIVILFILYFGLPSVGMRVSATLVAIVGLGGYGTSYVIEIVRSGLRSVGAEQEEAGLSIGLRRWDLVRRVIWPQALPVMLPPLTNEAVALLKNSSLLGFITVSELTLRSQQVISSTYEPLAVYIAAGVMYLVVNLALSAVMHRVEVAAAARLRPSTGSTVRPTTITSGA
jgi:cystine transport system permease protein